MKTVTQLIDFIFLAASKSGANIFSSYIYVSETQFIQAINASLLRFTHKINECKIALVRSVV